MIIYNPPQKVEVTCYHSEVMCEACEKWQDYFDRMYQKLKDKLELV